MLPFFFSSSLADKSHVHTRIAQSMVFKITFQDLTHLSINLKLTLTLKLLLLIDSQIAGSC